MAFTGKATSLLQVPSLDQLLNVGTIQHFINHMSRTKDESSTGDNNNKVLKALSEHDRNARKLLFTHPSTQTLANGIFLDEVSMVSDTLLLDLHDRLTEIFGIFFLLDIYYHIPFLHMFCS